MILIEKLHTSVLPSSQNLKNRWSNSSDLYRLLHSLGVYSRSCSFKIKQKPIVDNQATFNFTTIQRKMSSDEIAKSRLRTDISIFDQLLDSSVSGWSLVVTHGNARQKLLLLFYSATCTTRYWRCTFPALLFNRAAFHFMHASCTHFLRDMIR